MKDNCIHINPETGEVEDISFGEKVKHFAQKHSSFLAGVVGLIVGSVCAMISMNRENKVEEEEELEDAGE